VKKPQPTQTAQKPAAQPDKNPHEKRQVLYNRRARHEYFIDETYDAGLLLVGTEVKSIRAGQANLQDAFCRVENGEVWVYNMHIAPFTHGTHWNVEPTRKRKLLLHRREIDLLESQMEQKGFALIPLALYFQHGYAKMEIGLGRGKKLYDKREDIAKRDQEREHQREMSSRGRG
jgi:SsrA-binding protein